MSSRCEVKRGFRFSVRRGGRGLSKLWGAQEIKIGDADFDREFVVKGNPEEWVKALFRNTTIRRLVQSQPALEFRLGRGSLVDIALHIWQPRRFPRHKLQFLREGIIADAQRLGSILELFTETLSELERLGVTSAAKPR